ncbi:TBC1 domain family member 20-like [Tropilaelaps mercedesae]|uniref:TBC1 domain family member 20-like n=1 Tax=Tropilaelaps mercedesae TaxID=418985 RepID=A0A1V9Y2P4_9ACAR|nr:TBC1 domain family member 20-like [Tropilaelaps mercedesae]
MSRVLIAVPELHYYQGYHDVCVTVLFVVNGNEDATFAIMEHLSRTKLRVFMEPSINGTIRQLSTLYPLLGAINGSLRRFLEASNCGVVFLLPWCLTWYGHELRHYPTLTRLFDLFLSTEELMPVYLAAAIVLPHQDNLLKQECSLSSVHCYLGRLIPLLELSRNEFENRIIVAKDLLRRVPSKSLFHVEPDQHSFMFRKGSTSVDWENFGRIEGKQVATFLLDDFVVVTYRRDSTDNENEAYEVIEVAEEAEKATMAGYGLDSNSPNEDALKVESSLTCGERRFRRTMTTTC